jgi:hypothetical protein
MSSSRNNRTDADGSRADFKKALLFDRNDPEAIAILYRVASDAPMAWARLAAALGFALACHPP